ncbi:MAG TPA: bifunctional oligoribonuclease/PAP phosphatase NrnA [Verrucomicrobiae bacterium]|jgi:nanoRNase/pAp phosphatase (c-di-AMP/oligoRNAs hydrolase)|nr:bifunctional oligoribonuclease/PAP phosphatase NrnA [Verrucomicrobiae bacterium]
MKYLAICEDDLLFQFMRRPVTKRSEVLFLVQEAEAARRIRRRGGSGQWGDLGNENTYQKAHLERVHQVILFVRDGQLWERVYTLLRSLRPDLPILSLAAGKKSFGAHKDKLLSQLPLENIFEEFCAPQLLDTINRQRVEKIRSLFREKDKIHILLQHDPDPDAIGSALALRELLGRNRTTTPIVTFGEVTRPENVAMIRLLEIQIDRVSYADLHDDGAKLALVDVQPPYFGDRLGRVDLVVDHHPKRTPFAARFADLRTDYGATSTIFTDYLRAAGMEPSQRLATALLYGIKTDTLFLERGSHMVDVEAFSFLYPFANRVLIARMERPALPREDLESLGRALSRLQLDDGVAVIHMGEVKREDVIPQMAEFSLQIEGVEWGIVSGLCDNRVVISARNVGYVKSAGDIMKRLFDDIGSAGGHRAMAKAVIPVSRFKEKFGEVSEKAIREAILPLITQRDEEPEGA